MQARGTDSRVRIGCQQHDSMDPTCLMPTAQDGGAMVRGMFSWHTLGSLLPINQFNQSLASEYLFKYCCGPYASWPQCTHPLMTFYSMAPWPRMVVVVQWCKGCFPGTLWARYYLSTIAWMPQSIWVLLLTICIPSWLQLTHPLMTTYSIMHHIPKQKSVSSMEWTSFSNMRFLNPLLLLLQTSLLLHALIRSWPGVYTCKFRCTRTCVRFKNQCTAKNTLAV